MKHLLWKNLLRVSLPFAMIAVAAFAFAQYPNPISSNTIQDLVRWALQNLVLIAIPLAGLAIIVVGIRFVLAAASGNTGKITQARSLLVWVLIGTAVVVGALIIAMAVFDFLENLGGGGNGNGVNQSTHVSCINNRCTRVPGGGNDEAGCSSTTIGSWCTSGPPSPPPPPQLPVNP